MITTEVDGLDQLAVAEARGVEGMRDGIRDLIVTAAEAAKAEMLAGVPRSGKDNPEGTIAESIDIQSTAFDPGGAGGGGFWRTSVGPGEDAPEHLRFVLEGTGEHQPGGRGAFGPVSRQAMHFSDGNFSMTSRGQEANREWLDRAQDVANEVIRVGISSLDLKN